jgi:hypothetical protein
MRAGRLLIGVQTTLTLFHQGSFHPHGREPITTRGCSLREDMLRLNDLFEGNIDDTLEGLKQRRCDSMAFRLLSCSEESANAIHFWQYFERPHLANGFGIFSKRYCEDMLSQYVPEHHDDSTPLQLSAVKLAYGLDQCQTETCQSLETMIVCIVESGADLHAAIYGYTPLALLLNAIPEALDFLSLSDVIGVVDLRSRNLRRVLKVWLNILQRAGVDLAAYGAEESRTAQAPYFTKDPLQPSQSRAGNRWVLYDEFDCFTFTYGPTPDDWTVQFDMVEEYAGDFWRMTELLDGPELQAVPGSWVDT